MITNLEQNQEEVEKLLSLEIPPILWNKDADSFKGIRLTQYAGEKQTFI